MPQTLTAAGAAVLIVFIMALAYSGATADLLMESVWPVVLSLLAGGAAGGVAGNAGGRLSGGRQGKKSADTVIDGFIEANPNLNLKR